jgi:hypothetical protein
MNGEETRPGPAAYIVEVNDTIVPGAYTELHFDRDLSLRVKEPASQITRRHMKEGSRVPVVVNLEAVGRSASLRFAHVHNTHIFQTQWSAGGVGVPDDCARVVAAPSADAARAIADWENHHHRHGLRVGRHQRGPFIRQRVSSISSCDDRASTSSNTVATAKRKKFAVLKFG